MKMSLKRGEIVLVDLGDTKGSEVRKIRPCIIAQNDVGNKFSPTTIVIPITNRTNRGQPTQIQLYENMLKNSTKQIKGMVLTEQIRTIDNSRILSRIGMLSEESMAQIDSAILIALGIKIAG